MKCYERFQLAMSVTIWNNDQQNLMNVRLIRANLETQIVALTSTQSMLRAIKHYADLLIRKLPVHEKLIY